MKNVFLMSLALISSTACISNEVIEHLGSTDAANQIDGRDASVAPDAAEPPDAARAPDAAEPPDAGASGEVTAVVLFGRAPMAGVDVVFSGANGALIDSARTDTSGRASLDAPGIAMVTVASFDANDNSRELFTVANVSPGDRISFQLDDSFESNKATDAVISLPGRFVSAAAGPVEVYGVTAGCNGTAVYDPLMVPSLEIDRRCLNANGRFHVFARAMASDVHPLAFSFALDVVAGTTTSPTEIAMPPWRTDFIPVNVSVTNAPQAARVSVDVFTATDAGDFSSDTSPGPFPATLKATPVPGAELGFTLFAHYGVEGSTGFQPNGFSRTRQRGPIQETLALDASSLLLPRVFDVAVDASASLPVVRFTIDGDPSGADALYVVTAWREIVWTMLAAPDAGALVVPELPLALDAWRPIGMADRAIVTLFDRESAHGYDDVRELPFENLRASSTISPGERSNRSAQGWFFTP